jgi:hypothetical protein
MTCLILTLIQSRSKADCGKIGHASGRAFEADRLPAPLVRLGRVAHPGPMTRTLAPPTDWRPQKFLLEEQPRLQRELLDNAERKWYDSIKEDKTMIVAYSRLQKILEERRLSVPELHRRLQQQDQRVNIKSLYRLNDAHQPLARLDLRVAGAICQLCDVTLADLVDFSGQEAKLATLAADKQDRLDRLMDKNNQGKLSGKEQGQLQKLVRETQEITLHNARILAAQQRRLERH